MIRSLTEGIKNVAEGNQPEPEATLSLDDAKKAIREKSIICMECSKSFKVRTKKGEPGEVDVRPMVMSITEDEKGFIIDFDWQALYVSPIFVLQAVDPDFAHEPHEVFRDRTYAQGRLIKTAQFF